jgi:hypothetical protein
VVGEVGVTCDMHCGGGFIRCGAAPGVELYRNTLFLKKLLY